MRNSAPKTRSALASPIEGLRHALQTSAWLLRPRDDVASCAPVKKPIGARGTLAGNTADVLCYPLAIGQDARHSVHKSSYLGGEILHPISGDRIG